MDVSSENSEITIDISDTRLELSSESIREIDPTSKTREIFLDNGETLPACFNVDYKDIKEGKKIGNGQWGPVHKAQWRGRAVAVKKFNTTSQNVSLMSREVTLMLRLRHPNILKLLGFYLLAQDDRILKSTMIMELMDCDLDVYLARRRQRSQPQQDESHICYIGQSSLLFSSVTGYRLHDAEQLSNDECLYIIAQIATGMNHMHKLGYFHRDLKPQNVLVRKSNIGFVHIKIADFGCSEFGASSDRNVGTLRYKAPEQYSPSAELFPEKLDVYSFAVLCSKILTGDEPYGGHLYGLRLKEHIRSGGKPRIPDHDLPADVATLIKQCLDINPKARPDFQQICDILGPVMNGIWEKPLVQATDRNGLIPRDPYFINSEDIRLHRNIGGGGESDIYEVQWKGCMYAGRVMFHQNHAKKRRELYTKLNHRNVVRFMGYSTFEDYDLLLMELMRYDLRALLDTSLRKSGGIVSTRLSLEYGIFLVTKKDVRPFDEGMSRYIMKEIAQGMEYLHNKDVLHGDLKTTNILVSQSKDGMIIKLTDFSGSLSSRPTFWSAPEALKATYGFHFAKRSIDSDKKMEVYNFGMVCYEILTGIIPFDEQQIAKQSRWPELRNLIIRGKRPKLPERTSQDLKELIERCWHQDPAMRPQFSEICEQLRSKPMKPSRLQYSLWGFIIWGICLYSIPILFGILVLLIKGVFDWFLFRQANRRTRRTLCITGG